MPIGAHAMGEDFKLFVDMSLINEKVKGARIGNILNSILNAEIDLQSMAEFYRQHAYLGGGKWLVMWLESEYLSRL